MTIVDRLRQHEVISNQAHFTAYDFKSGLRIPIKYSLDAHQFKYIVSTCRDQLVKNNTVSQCSVVSFKRKNSHHIRLSAVLTAGSKSITVRGGPVKMPYFANAALPLQRQKL